jgi:hypothetical protein
MKVPTFYTNTSIVMQDGIQEWIYSFYTDSNYIMVFVMIHYFLFNKVSWNKENTICMLDSLAPFGDLLTTFMPTVSAMTLK